MRTKEVIDRLAADVAEAQDDLLWAKTDQTISANLHRADNFAFQVGDKVMLSTLNRRNEYKKKGHTHVAKFMPCFDGPYMVTAIAPHVSTITLDMPNTPNAFPVFHTSQVCPLRMNDTNLFPSRKLERPGPVLIDGEEEFTIDHILDEHRRGHRTQYLVCWCGYGHQDD